MKQKYIGACLLIVGAILILHSNWALLPAPFDIPKQSIAFSIPADGSSYTEIDTIEIIIADPALSDPNFLKTVKYNDTILGTVQLFKDPIVSTKWLFILDQPLKTEGQYHFCFVFWSWEGLPYPWPNGASGGTYSIIIETDGNNTIPTLPGDWLRVLETVSGVAFLGSGVIMIVRRKNRKGARVQL